MKKIKFDLEELEICFVALSYMYSNVSAREEYKNLLLENKIEFPSNELDIISSILINYNDSENMLQNFNVVKELTAIQKYSEITQYSLDIKSEIYFKTFIERIIGNVDQCVSIPLVSYEDSKKAFISYVGGNFKAIINSSNEYKFIKWNGNAWIMLTEEEGRMVYNNFIKECNFELEKNMMNMEKDDFSKLTKKVNSWDNKNRVSEALDKLKRDEAYSINLRYHKRNENILCSNNGLIIDFNKGEIKKSCRNDLILNTSKYNLMDKQKSEKFVKDKLKLYRKVLGTERLEFILDLIAYKMLGKNLQLAIFMIGGGATGKSTFKNIVKDLFEDNAVNIPYTYFTTRHKGNDDVSRDDLLVSLDSKLFGLSSEGDTTDIINQAKFKNILSNSTEKARPTRGKLIDIDLQKLDLLIDTNDIPQFTNYDDAVNRRLLFIKFINKIPLEQRNTNFYKEDIKNNFNYVFSYFIYRAMDMREKTLIIPKIIKEDTIQNIKELDSLLKFSNEIIAPVEGFYIGCEEVEKAYIKMCEDDNLINIIPGNIIGTAKGYNYFVNKLKEKQGYENIERVRKSDGSSNRKHYVISGVTFLG